MDDTDFNVVSYTDADRSEDTELAKSILYWESHVCMLVYEKYRRPDVGIGAVPVADYNKYMKYKLKYLKLKKMLANQ